MVNRSRTGCKPNVQSTYVRRRAIPRRRRAILSAENEAESGQIMPTTAISSWADAVVRRPGPWLTAASSAARPARLPRRR